MDRLNYILLTSNQLWQNNIIILLVSKGNLKFSFSLKSRKTITLIKKKNAKMIFENFK